MTRRERLRKEMLETTQKLKRMYNSMEHFQSKYGDKTEVVIRNISMDIVDVEYNLEKDDFLYHFEGYCWYPLLGYYNFKIYEKELDNLDDNYQISFRRM